MNGYLESVTASGTSWLGFGLSVFFKSLSLLALAWIVTLALRKASAAVRHWVWTLGLVGLLVLPIASMTLPTWKIPISTKLVPPATVDYTPSLVHAPQIARSDRVPSHEKDMSYSPAPRGNSSAAPWSWTKVALAVWLGVFTALAARLIAGFVASRYMIKRASNVSDEKWVHLLDELSRHLGLSRYVQLLQTRRSMVPITCGVFRPQILLPTGTGEWPGERRRSVLLHELGHVRRHDCLTQWVAQFVCAVYWWNPLVWFAFKQIRQESERACDDLVLDAGTRASDYAHDLLEMARALNVTRRSPLASVTLAHRSRFEDRLLSILDPKASRHTLSRTKVLASVLVAGALLVAIAALQPSARAQETAPSSPAKAREEIGTVSGSSEAEESPQAETASRETVSGQAPQSEKEQSDEARHERTLTALMEALRDPEPSVREQAVGILARMRHAPAVAPLMEALNDEDAQVRESAAWALGLFQDDRASEPLLESLHDEAPKVREQAAWALGMLKDSRAVESLGAALGDSAPDVREQAAWALGMIQDERSVDSLSNALGDDDENVREQAAWALGMIRDESATSGLAATLKDEDADVREQAVWALGMIQASEAVAPLIEFLKDADPDVREQAAWALGMIRDERATLGLAATLKDEDVDVREQAVWALGMIQDSRAADALHAAMKDDDPDVREQAAWALGMIALTKR